MVCLKDYGDKWIIENGSDAGAVPAVSTKIRSDRLWGRNRLRRAMEDTSFARHDTAVIGSFYRCQRQ